MMQLRIAGTVENSIVDGEGIRYTIFVQGCPHGCPGCHNPQTHDFQGGKLIDAAVLLKEIASDPLLDGVTFQRWRAVLSGGSTGGIGETGA